MQSNDGGNNHGMWKETRKESYPEDQEGYEGEKIMGIFTALAIAAAVGAGGAIVSNKQRRNASTARNVLNAAGKPIPTGAGVTQAGSGTPQGSTSRPRGQAGKRSKTTYTETLGLSQEARSGINLKQLTGQ